MELFWKGLCRLLLTKSIENIKRIVMWQKKSQQMQFWYFSFETRYIIIFHNDEKWISSLTEKICEITFRSYIWKIMRLLFLWKSFLHDEERNLMVKRKFCNNFCKVTFLDAYLLFFSEINYFLHDKEDQISN